MKQEDKENILKNFIQILCNIPITAKEKNHTESVEHKEKIILASRGMKPKRKIKND